MEQGCREKDRSKWRTRLAAVLGAAAVTPALAAGYFMAKSVQNEHRLNKVINAYYEPTLEPKNPAVDPMRQCKDHHRPPEATEVCGLQQAVSETSKYMGVAVLAIAPLAVGTCIVMRRRAA